MEARIIHIRVITAWKRQNQGGGDKPFEAFWSCLNMFATAIGTFCEHSAVCFLLVLAFNFDLAPYSISSLYSEHIIS